MKEINVDFIEQTEEGLVKKNFTTKMKLVDGLEATIQGLESQIANAGKVDSVNNKQGDVVLTGSDLMVSMSWSSSISDVIWDLHSNKADQRDLEDLKSKTEPYTKPALFKGDMDDLVDMGRYYVADTATNKPASGGWFCDVYVANIQSGGHLHKYQVAYKMTGSKVNYARNQFGGNWTEWQRIDGIDKADKEYVDSKLKEKANTHHTHYAHDIFDNTTNKTQLEINKELFQSGVESNKTLVDALNSKGVSASTSDTIKTNVGKVGSIQLATGNASRSDVLSGRTFSNSSNTGLTGTMTNNGSLNRTISMQNGSVNVSPGYYSGGQVKANITNLEPKNIKKGISVGGVAGSLVGIDPGSIYWSIKTLDKDEKVTHSLSSSVDTIIITNMYGQYTNTMIILDRDGGLKSSLTKDKIKIVSSTSTSITIENTGYSDTSYFMIEMEYL